VSKQSLVLNGSSRDDGPVPLRHALAAVLVTAIWGANFVVIERGLVGVPPLLFVALRFLVVILAIPFVRRPSGPLWKVLAIGAAMSLGQFAFLYSSLTAGMPPGLASLILQLQAVFTVCLAALVLAERPVAIQWLGVALGVAGLAIVGLGRGGHIPLGALLLTISGAACWGLGNVLVRWLKVEGGLGLTVWSGLIVPLPLLALSAGLDGPSVVVHALTHLTWVNIASTAYTAVLSSLVGYGIWNWLLHHHPASEVAPFSLLVPAVGIVTAALADGERFTALATAGGVLLVVGVAAVSLGPRVIGRIRARGGRVSPTPSVP